MHISEAILYVIDRHFTTVTKRARGEIKTLEPFPQLSVALLVPDLQQVAFTNIADKIFPGCALTIPQVVFVCVK